MSEEQDIPEEEITVNGPQPTEENLQPLTDSQSQILNQKSEIGNMEAHHPHHVTHKKKWPEYLVEFFMLFLAVFLGFIAENIRENIVEKERGKQYISSLYEDLKSDTSRMNSIIKYDDEKIAALNNLEFCYDTVMKNWKETSC